MRRFLLRVLVAAAVLAPAWWVATPLYNRYLVEASKTLLHLFEDPDVTRLALASRHDALLLRIAFPPVRQLVGGFRLTDLHFSVIPALAVLLANPINWKTRLGHLLYAAPLLIAFHLALILSHVYGTYATDLGPWSEAHYGPLARNGLALFRHLLHLPLKLALPLLAWGFCCYPRLYPSS